MKKQNALKIRPLSTLPWWLPRGIPHLKSTMLRTWMIRYTITQTLHFIEEHLTEYFWKSVNLEEANISFEYQIMEHFGEIYFLKRVLYFYQPAELFSPSSQLVAKKKGTRPLGTKSEYLIHNPSLYKIIMMTLLFWPYSWYNYIAFQILRKISWNFHQGVPQNFPAR